MNRPLLLVGIAAALAGCGQRARPGSAVDPSLCDVSRLKVLVGRPASAVAASEALHLSGARTIRWIEPKSAVTMDFQPDRLNVVLGGNKRVRRFTCG